MRRFWESPIGSLAINLIAAAIASLATLLVQFLIRRFRQRQIKRFFGRDFYERGVSLTFPPFAFRGTGYMARADGQLAERRWNPERPFAAVGDLKAVAHLATIFESAIKGPTALLPDSEVRGEFDLNFAAVGFETNLQSRQAFENAGNRSRKGAIQLVNVGYPSQIKLIGGTELPRPAPKDCEYGLILKIHPREFPNRTWFVCGGEGECATTAAGYFLANKWREIYRRVGSKSFAAVVRVKSCEEQSAVLECIAT